MNELYTQQDGVAAPRTREKWEPFTGTEDEISALLRRRGAEAARTGQVVLVSRPRTEPDGQATVSTALAAPEFVAQHDRLVQLRVLEPAPAPRRRGAGRWTWAHRRAIATVTGSLTAVAGLVTAVVLAYLWLMAHLVQAIGALTVTAVVLFAAAKLLGGRFCPGCLCGACKGGH